MRGRGQKSQHAPAHVGGAPSELLASLGLVDLPCANASAALRLIPRTMHYLTKPSARALQIVQKVGHRSGTRKIH